MSYERLLEAFYKADAGEQWRSFARAVVVAIRDAGGHSADVERLVRSGAVLVEQRASEDALKAHRVAVWRFLEAKNGSSAIVRDADDRALRALLTVLEPVEDEGTAAECAEWVEEVLTSYSAVSAERRDTSR